jgi:hypothetical protein
VHRDRPAGINLTWQVARGDTSEKVLHQAIVADAEAASDPTAAKGKKKRKSPFWKGTMPRRQQQRGTVQKDVFEWTRGAHGNVCRLAITAKATRPRHAEEKQRYAVVVTLEAPNEEINIYQAIRTRLAAARVRVRVPAG